MKKQIFITDGRCILERVSDRYGIYRLVYGKHSESQADGTVVMRKEEAAEFDRCWWVGELAKRGDKRRAFKMEDAMNGVFYAERLRDIILERGYTPVLGLGYYKKK